MIKDSGERTQFDTGAVRDMHEDRIRGYTDEELAEMMVYKDCPTIEMSLFNCPEKYCPEGETHDCRQCWLDWLKQEVKD